MPSYGGTSNGTKMKKKTSEVFKPYKQYKRNKDELVVELLFMKDGLAAWRCGANGHSGLMDAHTFITTHTTITH
jgi:hypothetical protein